MSIAAVLEKAGVTPVRVVNFDRAGAVQLDLSKQNQALARIDLNNPDEFSGFIDQQVSAQRGKVGWGGYLEERGLYSRSDLFLEEEPRTIHLGIDIWAEAGTKVVAPLDSEVHSFENRKVHGDYGPVIILKHDIGGTIFHTLYGHLSTESLVGLEIGKPISAGQCFASFGKYEENFHWPPHLHFQVIVDMQDYQGDYPGVCKASEKQYYAVNCPDPSVFLF